MSFIGMRDLIVVYTPLEVNDGQGGIEITSTPTATIWASVSFIDDQKGAVAGAHQDIYSAYIVIRRASASVKTGMRVSHNGHDYVIKKIVDFIPPGTPPYLSHYQQLLCVEV